MSNKKPIPEGHIRLYISRHLVSDLEKIYEDHTGKNLSKTRRNKIYFICSTIHLFRVRKGLKKSEAVPIYSKFWDNTLGRDYDLISKILPNLPIRNASNVILKGTTVQPCLVQRTAYQPSGYHSNLDKGIPYGYRLAPRYARDIYAVDLEYKTLANRVRSLRSKYLQAIFKEFPNCKFLYDCQLLIGFSPRINKVLEQIERESGSESRKLAEGLVEILSENREEDFDFSLSRRVNRIFYIPNRLKREIRPHILLNGEPTEEIDIPASQPLFLSTLYSRNHSPEKNRYLKLVKSGKFYEKLRSWTPTCKGLTKQEMKPKVFSQIFFSANKKGVPPLLKAFKNQFPVLADLMWQEKINDHTALSCKLQRLESDFIFGTVIERLRRDNIPCLCIHDSVVVPKSKARGIKKWFFKSLEDYMKRWD